jgi:uncharacterized protein with HEPN domain
MKRDDSQRLSDMLIFARDAVGFARGRARTDLSEDRMLYLAIVKAVEIIGEASSQVSQETRSQYPHIAWSGMIGMRHILVHAYGSIDLVKLWNTVQNDLPVLIDHLEAILPPDERGDQ